MRFLARMLLLAGLFLAGCGPKELSSTLTVSYLPYVAVGGMSQKIKPGSGVKIGSGSFTVVSEENEGSLGFQGYFAWSHHDAAPGSPAADYVRLEMAMTFPVYWTGRQSTPVRLGCDTEVGLTFHSLAIDGLGDVTGFGPSGSAALRLRLGRQAYLTAGLELEFWLTTDWEFAGTIAPFARFGMQF